VNKLVPVTSLFGAVEISSLQLQLHPRFKVRMQVYVLSLDSTGNTGYDVFKLARYDAEHLDSYLLFHFLLVLLYAAPRLVWLCTSQGAHGVECLLARSIILSYLPSNYPSYQV